MTVDRPGEMNLYGAPALETLHARAMQRYVICTELKDIMCIYLLFNSSVEIT